MSLQDVVDDIREDIVDIAARPYSGKLWTMEQFQNRTIPMNDPGAINMLRVSEGDIVISTINSNLTWTLESPTITTSGLTMSWGNIYQVRLLGGAWSFWHWGNLRDLFMDTEESNHHGRFFTISEVDVVPDGTGAISDGWPQLTTQSQLDSYDPDYMQVGDLLINLVEDTIPFTRFYFKNSNTGDIYHAANIYFGKVYKVHYYDDFTNRLIPFGDLTELIQAGGGGGSVNPDDLKNIVCDTIVVEEQADITTLQVHKVDPTDGTMIGPGNLVVHGNATFTPSMGGGATDQVTINDKLKVNGESTFQGKTTFDGETHIVGDTFIDGVVFPSGTSDIIELHGWTKMNGFYTGQGGTFDAPISTAPAINVNSGTGITIAQGAGGISVGNLTNPAPQGAIHAQSEIRSYSNIRGASLTQDHPTAPNATQGVLKYVWNQGSGTLELFT